MKRIAITVLTILVGSLLYAQNRAFEANLNYTTEFQYNFNRSYNWVNLLSLNAQLSSEAIGAWRNGFWDMELISIYRTSEERILNDLQTFSNIDEQSVPLGIFTFGYTHKIGTVDLFVGIRNVNRDYFTAAYTSLFTNSSCGIYPTISANYPLANYPLSAMCLHAAYEIGDNWLVKNSLYNGVAYKPLAEIFTVNPQCDGVFNMTSVDYIHKSKYGGTYGLGSAIHSGMPVYGEEEEGQPISKKKTGYTLWTNAEQCIYSYNNREIGVMGQCSFAPLGVCSEYYGAGVLFNGWLTHSKSDQLGIFVNRATFESDHELILELT